MPVDPLPLEVRLGLRAGSVYYFQARELTSAEPHYFIVVNRDPLGTRLLLLTIVTSQLDRVRLRNRSQPDTVVMITPAEYPELRVESAVDANVVLSKPLSELVELVRRREVRYHRDLPSDVFARLRAAILASRVVTDEIKAAL